MTLLLFLFFSCIIDEKKLVKMALTKGTLYPIIKKIASWFSVNLTKQMFAGFFRKAIPVVGGVLGGGITYLSFKPCCDKLKESLQETFLTKEILTVEEKDFDITTEIVEDK